MGAGVTVCLCILVGVAATRIIETPALEFRDRLFPSRGRAIALPEPEPAVSCRPASPRGEPVGLDMEWTLISSVNNDEVLNSCLLSSPDARSAADIRLQRGYSGAAAAFNAGIDQAQTDLLVFVHQDVYLPEGWIGKVQRAIEVISKTDPDWGVLGVWGGGRSGAMPAGFVYDGGWRKVLGNEFDGGVEIDSLDEVVLILRKSAGLRFDPAIPGFHMYGADICQEARRQGRKCYAIAAFCIHNTNQYRMLPWQFWKGYLIMRGKWRAHLPIQTSCTRITFWCWPMLRWNLVRAINLATGRDKPPVKRVLDPGRVYRELIDSGIIAPLAGPAGAGSLRRQGS
jgi:hypothetical protein